jgi:hypothetical protein
VSHERQRVHSQGAEVGASSWDQRGILLWFNENGHLDKGDKIDGGGVRR